MLVISANGSTAGGGAPHRWLAKNGLLATGIATAGGCATAGLHIGRSGTAPRPPPWIVMVAGIGGIASGGSIVAARAGAANVGLGGGSGAGGGVAVPGIASLTERLDADDEAELAAVAGWPCEGVGARGFVC